MRRARLAEVVKKVSGAEPNNLLELLRRLDLFFCF